MGRNFWDGPVYVVEKPRNFHHRTPFGAQFKPAHRRAVRGGRWQVRKLIRNNRWRAWTAGQAKVWNMTFYTHEWAINWAQAVAYMYSRRDINDDVRYKALRAIRRLYLDLDKALETR